MRAKTEYPPKVIHTGWWLRGKPSSLAEVMAEAKRNCDAALSERRPKVVK